MSTTQSEDPNEQVAHPRRYNQHPSNVECIELIEHLPCNLANAVKYIWRCGLKQTETPLQELKKARWYTDREANRIELYELEDEPRPKTDLVWRALARVVIGKEEIGSLLGMYLDELLVNDYHNMLRVLDEAIEEAE